MTNFLLFLFIILFLVYAIYDQFVMERIKGKTLVKVRLKKRSKTDAVILIVLIVLLIYQDISTLSALTLYLFAMTIILIVYGAFIRAPVFLLKSHGLFYGNLFTYYRDIVAINLTETKDLIIDLNNRKRFIIQPENPADLVDVLTQLIQLGVISKESQSLIQALVR